ncbi:hypothetical protein BDP27DRAFT_1309792, partial [Rhodocollybia butyracea]
MDWGIWVSTILSTAAETSTIFGKQVLSNACVSDLIGGKIIHSLVGTVFCCFVDEFLLCLVGKGFVLRRVSIWWFCPRLGEWDLSLSVLNPEALIRVSVPRMSVTQRGEK